MSLQILTFPARTAMLAALLTALPIGVAQADRFNRSVESIHQPVVQRSDYVLDVSAAGLDPAESARVHDWLDAIDLRYGDRIGVDSQAGGKGSNADIAAIVESYGLFLNAGTPVTEGAIAPGQVRIVVSRSTASVPGCPDYSQASQPNFTASASSNYGCATNSNLAAMVADPEDLVRGQDKRGTDAEIATKAIRIWRNTDPSGKNGVKAESTKGGN
ncbi:CpaD family pilus assembly protein [Sphingomonas sp. Root710]|uniref:CpaD family pilus assembly protein n=1 Tax=Sphingomonas sp. Root710 TaxID=1736594 RepID=UPI000B204428|nr:CpaD family pilus assembly lipoprotein [Sphingomonas sp. Root710]